MPQILDIMFLKVQETHPEFSGQHGYLAFDKDTFAAFSDTVIHQGQLIPRPLFDAVLKALAGLMDDSHQHVRVLIKAVVFLWCAKHGTTADVLLTIRQLELHMGRYGPALFKAPFHAYVRRLIACDAYGRAITLIRVYTHAVRVKHNQSSPPSLHRRETEPRDVLLSMLSI